MQDDVDVGGQALPPPAPPPSGAPAWTEMRPATGDGALPPPSGPAVAATVLAMGPGEGGPEAGGDGVAGKHRRRWPLVLAVVVVVALVAAGTVVFLTRDRGPSYPSAWDPRLADLVSAVEKEKHATFRHPIRAVFLDDAAFKKRVGVDQSKLSKDDRKQIARTEETLRALGLQGGTGSLLDQVNTLQTEGVAAFYDPHRKEIVIPESPAHPLAAKKTLVHELTHALQDQLGQLHEPDDSDAKDAFTALVEGDAEHVATKWADGLSDDDRQALDDQSSQESEQATTGVKSVNPALVAEFTAPYGLGEPMVAALDTAGKLAAAFDHPPHSSADVLDPARWLQPVDVVRVPVPALAAGERKEGDLDTMGAQTLYLMLATALPPAKALAAASGWGGDRMTFFRAADGAGCLRVAVAGVDAAATARIQDAVGTWVASRPQGAASSKSVDGRVEFDACDRGSAAATLTDAVAGIPTDRAQVVLALTQQGLNVPKAACVASGLVDRLPPDLFESQELSPDQQDQLMQAMQEVATSCPS